LSIQNYFVMYDNSSNTTNFDHDKVGGDRDKRTETDSLIVIGIILLVVVIVIDTVVRITIVCKSRKQKRAVKPFNEEQQINENRPERGNEENRNEDHNGGEIHEILGV